MASHRGYGTCPSCGGSGKGEMGGRCPMCEGRKKVPVRTQPRPALTKRAPQVQQPEPIEAAQPIPDVGEEGEQGLLG